MKNYLKPLAGLMLPLALAACVAPSQIADNEPEKNLTVGTVQKEIRIGMSGADVASVLGSPNMVSTDSERREVWIYDKVSTNSIQSSSNAWVFAVIAGGNTGSKTKSTSQKTLTIIIKFDSDQLVRDFSYHASSF